MRFTYEYTLYDSNSKCYTHLATMHNTTTAKIRSTAFITRTLNYAKFSPVISSDECPKDIFPVF